MPSSFGFDKLYSISKSLTFIQFYFEQTRKKMFRVAVSVMWSEITPLHVSLYHVMNYFTVYFTIDKLSRMAIIPLQYWTVTAGTKLHSNSSSLNSQLQVKKSKPEIHFILHLIGLSPAVDSSLANKLVSWWLRLKNSHYLHFYWLKFNETYFPNIIFPDQTLCTRSMRLTTMRWCL